MEYNRAAPFLARSRRQKPNAGYEREDQGGGGRRRNRRRSKKKRYARAGSSYGSCRYRWRAKFTGSIDRTSLMRTIIAAELSSSAEKGSQGVEQERFVKTCRAAKLRGRRRDAVIRATGSRIANLVEAVATLFVLANPIYIWFRFRALMRALPHGELMPYVPYFCDVRYQV